MQMNITEQSEQSFRYKVDTRQEGPCGGCMCWPLVSEGQPFEFYTTGNVLLLFTLPPVLIRLHHL